MPKTASQSCDIVHLAKALVIRCGHLAVIRDDHHSDMDGVWDLPTLRLTRQNERDGLWIPIRDVVRELTGLSLGRIFAARHSDALIYEGRVYFIDCVPCDVITDEDLPVLKPDAKWLPIIDLPKNFFVRCAQHALSTVFGSILRQT